MPFNSYLPSCQNLHYAPQNYCGKAVLQLNRDRQPRCTMTWQRIRSKPLESVSLTPPGNFITTYDLSVHGTVVALLAAMSGLEIAAAIVTFISASRKVADGISRLSGLRHAPDVLLALNNELADLQCVLVSHCTRSRFWYLDLT